MLTALETGATTRIEHPNGIFSSPQPLPRGLNGWEPDMLFELDIPVGFVPRIVENNEIDPDPFSDPKIATAVDVRYLLGQYPSPEALPTHPDFLTEPRIAQFPLTTTKNGETFDLEPYDLTPDPLSQRYFDQQANLAGIRADVAKMSPSTDPDHLGRDIVYLAEEIGAMALTEETPTGRLYVERSGRLVPKRGGNDGYHRGRDRRDTHSDPYKSMRSKALAQSRDDRRFLPGELKTTDKSFDDLDPDEYETGQIDENGFEVDVEGYLKTLAEQNRESEQAMHLIPLPHGTNNFPSMTETVREAIKSLAYDGLQPLPRDVSPQELYAPDGADTSDAHIL